MAGWGAVPIRSNSHHQEPPTPPNTPAAENSRPGAPQPLNVVSWLHAPILESPTTPLVGRSPPAGGEPYKRMHHPRVVFKTRARIIGCEGFRRRAPPTHPTGKVNAFRTSCKCKALSRSVFPAHVGLSRGTRRMSGGIMSFPRTRGVEPAAKRPRPAPQSFRCERIPGTTCNVARYAGDSCYPPAMGGILRPGAFLRGEGTC